MSVYVPTRTPSPIRAMKESQISTGKIVVRTSPIQRISDNVSTTPSLENRSRSRDEFSKAIAALIALVKSYRAAEHGKREDYLYSQLNDGYLDHQDKLRLVQVCIDKLWRLRAPEDTDLAITRASVLKAKTVDNNGMPIKGLTSLPYQAQKETRQAIEAEEMQRMLAVKDAKEVVIHVVSNAKKRYAIPKAPEKPSWDKPSIRVNPSTQYNRGTITIFHTNRFAVWLAYKSMCDMMGYPLSFTANDIAKEKENYVLTLPVSCEDEWTAIKMYCVTLHNQPITTEFRSLWTPSLAASRFSLGTSTPLALTE